MFFDTPCITSRGICRPRTASRRLSPAGKPAWALGGRKGGPPPSDGPNGKAGTERPTLTPRLVEIAREIQWHRDAKGYGPTYQAVADVLGVAKETVFFAVRRLCEKGIVEYRPDGLTVINLQAVFPRPTLLTCIGEVS